MRLRLRSSTTHAVLQLRRSYSSETAKFHFLVSPAYCAKARYVPPDATKYNQLYYEEEHQMPNSESSQQKTRPDTGDDAYFYTTWTEPGPLQGSMAIGVADGVGGVAKQGIDPSNLSNSLLEEVGQLFRIQQKDAERKSLCSPVTLLRNAYDSLRADRDRFQGATTACLATVHSQTGILACANLGDSGYYVFRKGRLLAHSRPQIINFNTPYQLRILSEDYYKSKQGTRKARVVESQPEECDIDYIELQHGDLVVMATDGLSDNLYLHDILKCITAGMISSGNWVINEKLNKIDVSPIGQPLKPPTPIVRQLVSMALNISTDPNYPSPFAANVRRMLDIVSLGGKPDDITVLAMVVEQQAW